MLLDVGEAALVGRARDRARNDAGVTIANNGEEALEAMQSQRFDLILMDIQMPVMDGFESARTICDLKKRGGVKKNMPIIALTANAMKGDRERCFEAGMDDHVAKPVRKRDLLDALLRVKHARRAQAVPLDG